MLVNADGNSSTETTSVSLDASTGIDANAPEISAISIATGTHIVGDLVAITISAAEAESNLSLAEGSAFNGQELSGFDASSATAGDYVVTYTVTEGDPDIADGNTLSASITLSDAFGNLSATEESLPLLGASIDANSPSITDLTIADDNRIDASYDLANIVVSGNTAGVEDGQELTLRIGDTIIAYTDLSASDSNSSDSNSSDSNSSDSDSDSSISFSITFDLSTLSDGSYPVIADVADIAGNTAQSTVDVSIDAVIPSIESLTVAGDNQVNAQEIANPVTALGTIVDFEADQQVSLYIEETMQTDPVTALALVDASGTFSVDINLSSLSDGDYTVIADAYDSDSNLERFIGGLVLDTSAPEISSIVVATDNIINAAEDGAAEVSGSTNGADDGQSVAINIGGIAAAATISADSFSVIVDLGALADSSAISATADVSDSAGNAAAQASLAGIVKDTVAPELTITSVAGDNFIDGSEAAAVAIIGSTSGAENGQLVALSISDGSATVEASASVSDDSYSATVDLSSLADSASISVSASVADFAGNPATASADGIIKDTLAPAIALTSVADDNIINASEAATTVIVGSTSSVENGQLVSLTVSDGNTTFEVSTNVSDGAFATTLDLSGLADGSAISASANVADAAGNAAIAASIDGIIKDTVAPEISLASVAGDGVFGAAEMASVAIVGATVGVADGQLVALSVSDGSTAVEASASVSADAFSATVDLSSLADSTSIAVTADVDDAAGNPAAQASIGNIVKDTQAPELAITSVADDNVINAAEAASAAIVGSTVGVADGQVVSLSATDGTATAVATATVADAAFSTSIDLSGLAESTSIGATADVFDSAGNAAAQAILSYLVKDTIAPEISISSVAGDGVISASEVAAVAIIGATTGAEDGQVVSLVMTAGSVTLETNATVSAGSFSATLDVSSVADSASISLSADVADLAGNPAAQARVDNLVKNTSAPVISAVTVAGDDIINAAEVAVVDISGTTSGVEAGQPVALSIGGLSATALVDSSGAFSTAVDLSALDDASSISLTADVADAAGNSASQFSKSVVKDTEPPSIMSLVIAGDALIDNSNTLSAIAVSGSVSGAEVGQSVMLTAGAASATAQVDAAGAFDASINLSGFANGTYSIVAEVADLAGNPADPFSASFVIEIVLPNQAVIAASISLSADTGSSATDFITSQAQQTISAELNATLDSDYSLYASVDSGANWHEIFSEGNLSGATSFAWETILIEGENAIQFRVADIYDKNGSLTEQIYVLDTYPSEQSISYIKLSDDSGASDIDLLTNVATQTISASLDPGLESGDSLYGSVDSGTSWQDISDKINATGSLTWDGVELQTGSHLIILRITDIADNNSSFEREYTLDQTLPAVNIIGTDTNATEASTATLDSSTSADSSGVASHSWAQVESDGEALMGDALAISAADSAIAQIIIPAIVDDSVSALSFYFVATITDNAGNSATSLPITIVVSNSYQSPTISAITPILDIASGSSGFFDQVGLSWDANSSLGYYLYRSSSATCAISSYSLCPDSTRYISGVDFAISNASASVIDSGLELDSTYYYWLEAHIDSEVVSLNSPPLTVTTSAPALNDTGIDWGGDYEEGNNADCSSNISAPQDCDQGRDATDHDDSDGHAGFSFTKLDSNGNALAADATEWSCVQDNVTGLIWEVKTDDGGLRDKDDRYNWYNTDPATNGGDVGYADDDGDICYGYNSSDSATYCNTEAFVARVNAVGLCGATDWRVPDIEELLSIVDYSRHNPSIDADYFPKTKGSSYWSASPYASNKDYAWRIYFGDGYDDGRIGTYNFYVRLVRVGQ